MKTSSLIYFLIIVLGLLLFTYVNFSNKKFTPELTDILKAKNKIIIDVRSEREFQSGHIEGALHMPYENIESLIETKIQDKSAPIILYCAVGGRAAIAKKSLEKLGYTHTINGGGFQKLNAIIQNF